MEMLLRCWNKKYLLVDALDDVTTTPALLLCCGESGYWKLLRGVESMVDSV